MSTDVQAPKRRGFLPISGRALFFGGLVLLIVLVGGFAWLLFQPSKDTAPVGGIGIGQAAPDFTLTGVDGHPVTLSSFRGHPVIINFWASYCQPCQDEMPLLNSFYQEHQAEGLVILGINEGEPMATINDYAQRYKITYQVLSDPRYEFNSDSSYKPVSLPRTYFVDKQGIVRAVFNQELNPDTLQADYQSISA
ncbi:MAG TPA: TlpA disulfide reductase family protein [Ktedonobacterales bacterium]|jgi:cytochrome c biogenesis protein CcmG/thiol:disulfide interchange protein DsbE